MDVLKGWLDTIIVVGVSFVGVYAYYKIVTPSIDAIQRILKTGKAPSSDEQKAAMGGLALELGKIWLLPSIFLVVLGGSMLLAIPAMGSLSDALGEVLSTVTDNAFGGGTAPAPTQVPVQSSGGGGLVAPTPPPQVIYVEVTPVPTVTIRIPDLPAPVPDTQRTFP